ncbi:MAG: lytic transglycosylase domain-containing protein [Bryobacteraceae bacterium]|jgi:soluble lytic murein transglycosylase-like protein
MRLLGFLILWTTATAFAGEYAILTSGARLHVDRHELDGARVRLYSGPGFTELAAAEIRAFEPEETIPAPAPAPIDPPPLVVPVPRLPSPLELADAAADKYGLPRVLLRSMMAAESGFEEQAVSPKGAIGLMQLMPGTAQDLGIDPYDPAQNVDAAARYLRDLLDKYHGGLRHALAAYNAGPAVVDKYNGIPPFRETINYIYRIEKAYKADPATPPASR